MGFVDYLESLWDKVYDIISGLLDIVLNGVASLGSLVNNLSPTNFVGINLLDIIIKLAHGIAFIWEIFLLILVLGEAFICIISMVNYRQYGGFYWFQQWIELNIKFIIGIVKGIYYVVKSVVDLLFHVAQFIKFW